MAAADTAQTIAIIQLATQATATAIAAFRAAGEEQAAADLEKTLENTTKARPIWLSIKARASGASKEE